MKSGRSARNGLVRKNAASPKICDVAWQVREIEQALSAICTQQDNPLTLKGSGELAKLHGRLRFVRRQIETEAGL